MAKIGSAISNPNKIKILEILMKRDADLSRISKLMRMPEISTSKLVKDLVDNGFVLESEGVFKITEEGKKALKSLK